MKRFEEEQRREDERDGRRLLSIACRPEPALRPHQQLVVAEVVAPPPSPVAYVAMGSVSPNHFMQLESNLEEEEQHTFSMDDVSICDICPSPIYTHASSCYLHYVEVRFSGTDGGVADLGPEICVTCWKNNC